MSNFPNRYAVRSKLVRGRMRRFERALAVASVAIFLALPASPGSAQVCAELDLRTQAQVDAVACSAVTGSLAIRGAGITNLDGLSGITSVGGDLRLSNNALLESLDGLSAIVSVGGDLRVSSNPLLSSLEGLESLTSVGGGVSFHRNASMTRLDGLSGISSIGGGLDFHTEAALTSVEGLAGLVFIGGRLNFFNNASLLNLDGLDGVVSVGGSLLVEANPALSDLDGLSGVTSVGGELWVENNVSLGRFCGLYPLLDAGGLVGPYGVDNNAYDPTEAQILAAGICTTSIPVPGLGIGGGLLAIVGALGASALIGGGRFGSDPADGDAR